MFPFTLIIERLQAIAINKGRRWQPFFRSLLILQSPLIEQGRNFIRKGSFVNYESSDGFGAYDDYFVRWIYSEHKVPIRDCKLFHRAVVVVVHRPIFAPSLLYIVRKLFFYTNVGHPSTNWWWIQTIYFHSVMKWFIIFSFKWTSLEYSVVIHWFDFLQS